MTMPPNYRDLLQRPERMAGYVEYQKRYADTPRESDRALINLMERHLSASMKSVLDVGCSTGNLLRHIKRRRPDLTLAGRDVSNAAINGCRVDPELSGIRFEIADLLLHEPTETFDIVIANAVLYQFNETEYERAVRRMGEMTNPGGLCLVFDWFHRYEQDLSITEKSKDDPNGVTICCKSFKTATRIFSAAGYDAPEFTPFVIPIDLNRPDPDDPTDTGSRTIRTETGERLTFRGGLYQPWCFLAAHKPAR